MSNQNGVVAESVLNSFRARGFTDDAISIENCSAETVYETLRKTPDKYAIVIAPPAQARNLGFLCQCYDSARLTRPPVICYGQGSTYEAEQNGAIPTYGLGNLKTILDGIANNYEPPKTESQIIAEMRAGRPWLPATPPVRLFSEREATHKNKLVHAPQPSDGGKD